MPDNMKWLLIEQHRQKIGAIGFIGKKAAVIAAFYDDIDGDMDGEVSWSEWAAAKVFPMSLEGKAVTAVAQEARLNEDQFAQQLAVGCTPVADGVSPEHHVIWSTLIDPTRLHVRDQLAQGRRLLDTIMSLESETDAGRIARLTSVAA